MGMTAAGAIANRKEINANVLQNSMALQDDSQAHAQEQAVLEGGIQAVNQASLSSQQGYNQLQNTALANQGSLDNSRMVHNKGLGIIGGTAFDPFSSKLKMGYAGGGIVDDILGRIARKGYASGGVIPGKVNKAVADDVVINAKKGEYIIPQEVVAFKGKEFFDKVVKGSKKQLGIPDTIGPKSPDQPDSMGRMDDPTMDGGVGVGYGLGATVEQGIPVEPILQNNSDRMVSQVQSAVQPVVVQSAQNKAIPVEPKYDPRLDPNNYVNGTAGMYKSLDPRFHEAAAAQGTVDQATVKYRDRALENPMPVGDAGVAPRYTNADLPQSATNANTQAIPTGSGADISKMTPQQQDAYASNLRVKEDQAKTDETLAQTTYYKAHAANSDANTEDIKANGSKRAQEEQKAARSDKKEYLMAHARLNQMEAKRNELIAKGGANLAMLSPEEKAELKNTEGIEQQRNMVDELYPEAAVSSGRKAEAQKDESGDRYAQDMRTIYKALQKQGGEKALLDKGWTQAEINLSKKHGKSNKAIPVEALQGMHEARAGASSGNKAVKQYKAGDNPLGL